MTATTPIRVPPHNLDAEAALIGAMLYNPATADPIIDKISPDDFYKPAHGHIYEAARFLHTTGHPIDPITVGDRLTQTIGLDAIGGPATLIELVGSTPSSTSADRYATIVRDLSLQRRLIGIAAEIVEDGYTPTNDTEALIDRAEQRLYSLADTTRQRRATHLGDNLDAWLDRIEQAILNGQLPGVPTGYLDLDQLTIGLQPGQLIVAAGRPGMGKTSFGMGAARHAAGANHPTLLVSCEMSTEELTNRYVAAEARVDLERIRSTKLIEKDWPRISNAIGNLATIPLRILDDGHATITTIRAEARRTANQHGHIDLIVVDYIQLLDHHGNHQNREGEVAEIARDLKKLARELDVPVLALSQLNRGVEQRADKRPMLSDLRESGEIENAADIVMLLYRDDYYRPDSPDRGIAEVHVAKQRNGPTGTVNLAWLNQYATFANMARA